MIKKIILIFILALSLLMPTEGTARQINSVEAEMTAETFVRFHSADARQDARVIQIDPYLEDGIPMAYLMHLADSSMLVTLPATGYRRAGRKSSRSCRIVA